jgi:hypothetical protein
LALINTRWVGPLSVVPLTPARNAAVWSLSPIRIVPASPAWPAFAMATLSSPEVRLPPAPEPMATF